MAGNVNFREFWKDFFGKIGMESIKFSDKFYDEIAGGTTEEVVKKAMRAFGSSPEIKNAPGIPVAGTKEAGTEKRLDAVDTFVSEAGSLSPEGQQVAKSPGTFANQDLPTNTSDMSKEDAKLITTFTGQDGNIITREQLDAFTDQEKTKMLFDLTGKESKPWQVDLELSRLLFKALTIYEKNLRR